MSFCLKQPKVMDFRVMFGFILKLWFLPARIYWGNNLVMYCFIILEWNIKVGSLINMRLHSSGFSLQEGWNQQPLTRLLLCIIAYAPPACYKTIMQSGIFEEGERSRRWSWRKNRECKEKGQRVSSRSV